MDVCVNKNKKTIEWNVGEKKLLFITNMYYMLLNMGKIC